MTCRASISAEDALEHLVGMQAQAVNPPYVGLWTRISDFDRHDLGALLVRRRVVRIALMRSTLHLVTARDALVLRPLLADMLARTVSGLLRRHLIGVDPSELVSVATTLIQRQPLTFAELSKLLVQRWPDHHGNTMAQTVRNMVPLVQIPPRGLWDNNSNASHTTMAHWLGRELDDELSTEDFVLRYLGAFGPASVKDMQKWSGTTKLAATFERLGSRLRTYRNERGTELFDIADAPIPDAEEEVPVRFLPEFDNILLAHVDRDRIIAAEHLPLVVTNNGIVRSTILVDGFVRGRWRIDRSRDLARLCIEPFVPLTTRTVRGLTEEGMALLDFAAPEVERRDIRFEPPVAHLGTV
ncbi:winged helix DNA-binding domain-containing protein [Nocardia sp. CNY236]|uniref:winged helix DNA-binding domain-containing protein n=1 Tax=Nocardia sp. CNY236 TaxID=1169152 RepID=UPI0018C9A791|nr:winged helix DNA-binding domain-containing protein [Nocardia sp. CNY236]